MRNFYKKLALVFSAMAMVTLIAQAQTTVNYQITDGGDDVEEYRGVFETNPDGYMDITSSDLELCTQNAANKQAVGLIFRGVAIPKNATITNAYIQFTADDISSNGTVPMNIKIVGFKEANTSAPFLDAVFNCTTRPVTTASVIWDPIPWETKEVRDATTATNDIKTVVQELVNQSGWASGNNMGFKLTNEIEEKIHREAAAFEDASGNPELFVTYTAGVAVEKINADAGLVYPNPSTGRFTIKNASTGNFGYGIYTMNGSIVRSRDNISGSSTDVDMSQSAKGQYFVIVKSANQTAKSKLILK